MLCYAQYHRSKSVSRCPVQRHRSRDTSAGGFEGWNRGQVGRPGFLGILCPEKREGCSDSARVVWFTTIGAPVEVTIRRQTAVPVFSLMPFPPLGRGGHFLLDSLTPFLIQYARIEMYA